MADLFADSFHAARHFVSESHWQRVYCGNAGAIVRVGVTDPASCYSHQDVRGPDLWKWNVGLFQWFADLHELDSPHKFVTRGGHAAQLPPQLPSSLTKGA
jgi:hypothetical protein